MRDAHFDCGVRIAQRHNCDAARNVGAGEGHTKAQIDALSRGDQHDPAIVVGSGSRRWNGDRRHPCLGIQHENPVVQDRAKVSIPQQQSFALELSDPDRGARRERAASLMTS